MKHFKFLLPFLIFFAASFAQAQEATREGPTKLDPDELKNTPFSRSNWQDQFHLLFGFGANLGFFNSDAGQRSAGLGSDFRTDVGYYFGKKFAVEISANVTFNGLDEFVIWDTLFTVGFRFRLPFLNSSTTSIPYARVFGGYGPSVAFFKGAKPILYEGENASRVQIEGPVGGIGVGLFRVNKKGRSWFVELTAATHSLRELEVIKDDADIPVVIARSELKDNSVLRSITVSAGFVAF